MFLNRPHYPNFLRLNFDLIDRITIRKGFGGLILLKIVYKEPLKYFNEEITLQEFLTLLDVPGKEKAREIVYRLVAVLKDGGNFFIPEVIQIDG